MITDILDDDLLIEMKERIVSEDGIDISDLVEEWLCVMIDGYKSVNLETHSVQVMARVGNRHYWTT